MPCPEGVRRRCAHTWTGSARAAPEVEALQAGQGQQAGQAQGAARDGEQGLARVQPWRDALHGAARQRPQQRVAQDLVRVQRNLKGVVAYSRAHAWGRAAAGSWDFHAECACAVPGAAQCGLA